MSRSASAPQRSAPAALFSRVFYGRPRRRTANGYPTVIEGRAEACPLQRNPSNHPTHFGKNFTANPLKVSCSVCVTIPGRMLFLHCVRIPNNAPYTVITTTALAPW